jgi:hypothetical protein
VSVCPHSHLLFTRCVDSLGEPTGVSNCSAILEKPDAEQECIIPVRKYVVQ